MENTPANLRKLTELFDAVILMLDSEKLDGMQVFLEEVLKVQTVKQNNPVSDNA